MKWCVGDVLILCCCVFPQVSAAVEVLPRWPLGPVDVRGMTKQNAKHCKLLH
jgi:hypothetical protein